VGGRNGRQPGERSELAKHLAELRAEQAIRRARLYAQTESDEVAAISKLAANLWGNGRRATPGAHGGYGGFVEFDKNPITSGRMGVWKIGYFVDPPHPKGLDIARQHKICFQGATHAEIFTQVLLWKERRT
jgi:hypothetical protein